LNLEKLKKLHQVIRGGFEEWVLEAPESYKDDFLMDRTPIVITSRYGQNQSIGVQEEDVGIDECNWDLERDFELIRYITVAIATHVR
jgi:hypothetical protein